MTQTLQLPDSFTEAYMDAYGHPPTDEVRRWCQRELFHRIWTLLMDDDFVEAYRNGFIVKCGDGVTRRLFPRVLTYSADYPEK